MRSVGHLLPVRAARDHILGDGRRGRSKLTGKVSLDMAFKSRK